VAYGGVLLAAAGGCRRETAPDGNVASAASASAPASASGKGEFKALAPTADAPRPVGSESVRGRRFPVTLAVSDTNLTLEPVFGSPRKFSYESWAEWSFRQEVARWHDVDAGAACRRDIKVTPVSWLLPLLGLREATYQSCGSEAHPGGETRYTTLWIDLNEHSLGSPRQILLTELYDEAVIAEALRGDALVQKALKGSNVPAGLDALLIALAETPPVLEGERCYEFPEDLLARFVLHHQEGEQVAVRLGLPGAGPCRYKVTDIGLLLPKPKVLEDTFERMKREPELPYRSFFVVDQPHLEKTAVLHLTGAPQ
jgi:hypothetical protein